MKKITIEIPQTLWNHLRINSIHQKKDVDVIVQDLLIQYYDGRSKD